MRLRRAKLLTSVVILALSIDRTASDGFQDSALAGISQWVRNRFYGLTVCQDRGQKPPGKNQVVTSRQAVIAVAYAYPIADIIASVSRARGIVEKIFQSRNAGAIKIDSGFACSDLGFDRH
jgi:hypothetical protein